MLGTRISTGGRCRYSYNPSGSTSHRQLPRKWRRGFEEVQTFKHTSAMSRAPKGYLVRQASFILLIDISVLLLKMELRSSAVRP